MVNSLHWQGIARLADGLKPEAFAADGLVEAVRGPDDATFCLGVQWYPDDERAAHHRRDARRREFFAIQQAPWL